MIPVDSRLLLCFNDISVLESFSCWLSSINLQIFSEHNKFILSFLQCLDFSIDQVFRTEVNVLLYFFDNLPSMFFLPFYLIFGVLLSLWALASLMGDRDTDLLFDRSRYFRYSTSILCSSSAIQSYKSISMCMELLSQQREALVLVRPRPVRGLFLMLLSPFLAYSLATMG